MLLSGKSAMASFAITLRSCTVAFVHIVLGRMQPAEPWNAFAASIDDLLDPQKPVLLNYYSKDRLFSDEARNCFVEPDLMKLPCFDVFDPACKT